jgi:CubicO group peptidase (beta-lactamase class C family)
MMPPDARDTNFMRLADITRRARPARIAYIESNRPATRYPLASITKAVSGLLFAQFIDQGLIHPDDPVGKFLPDFPTTGEGVLTLRHCFTHTSGFEGHGHLARRRVRQSGSRVHAGWGGVRGR